MARKLELLSFFCILFFAPACGLLFSETDGAQGRESPDASIDSSDESTVLEPPNASDAAHDAEAGSSAADGSRPPTDFSDQVTAAFCGRLQICCLTSAAAWDQSQCEWTVNTAGGFRGLRNFQASFGNGNVAFNATLGAACLADVGSFPCGRLSPAQETALGAKCFGAIVPSLAPDGGPCATSIECPPGTRCSTSGGACAPLLPIGATCTHRSNDECTYLGEETPTAYCALPADGGSGTCLPTKPLSSGCLANIECTSTSCESSTCSGSVVLSDPGIPGGICDKLTIRDAGGD